MEEIDKRLDRVVGLDDRVQPPIEDPIAKDLVYDSIAEPGFALIVMIESAFGDAGRFEYRVDVSGAEAAAVNLAKSRLQKTALCRLGLSAADHF